MNIVIIIVKYYKKRKKKNIKKQYKDLSNINIQVKLYINKFNNGKSL
jgi:hypothetical protein